MIPDKITHAVEYFFGCGKIVKHYRQLVFMKRLIHIGDIRMNHIKQAIVLYDDNAVAIGMALCLDKIDPVANLLTCREIVVRTIGKLNRDKMGNALKLGGRKLIFIDVCLRIWERAKHSGMIAVLSSFNFSHGYSGHPAHVLMPRSLQHFTTRYLHQFSGLYPVQAIS